MTGSRRTARQAGILGPCDRRARPCDHRYVAEQHESPAPDDRPDVPEVPDDPEHESAYALLQRGQALMKSRHHAQAAIVLERAAREEPGKGSILEPLGRAYHHCGPVRAGARDLRGPARGRPVGALGPLRARDVAAQARSRRPRPEPTSGSPSRCARPPSCTAQALATPRPPPTRRSPTRRAPRPSAGAASPVRRPGGGPPGSSPMSDFASRSSPRSAMRDGVRERDRVQLEALVLVGARAALVAGT